MYFAVGRDLPLFGSAVAERALRGEVEVYKAEVDKRLRSTERGDTERLDRLQSELRAREANHRRLERRGMVMGAVLYPLLGGFFAAGVATSWLQAVVIGAGWTGVASAMGLRRAEAQSGEARQEQRAKMEQDVTKLEAERDDANARFRDLADAFEEFATRHGSPGPQQS